jgi:hypothetical protein
MEHPRIDISEDLDGRPVVHACFDLTEREVAASAHAVTATVSERFRTAALSADDVVEFRELTALADELGELGVGPRTIVFRPARLSAYRDALARFVETRVGAEWIREDDREPLEVVRAILPLLDQLCAEAMRAAIAPAPRTC